MWTKKNQRHLFSGILHGCIYILDREICTPGILSSFFHSRFPLAARLLSCQLELETVGFFFVVENLDQKHMYVVLMLPDYQLKKEYICPNNIFSESTLPFGRPTNAVHTQSAHKPYMIQCMNDQKIHFVNKMLVTMFRIPIV